MIDQVDGFFNKCYGKTCDGFFINTGEPFFLKPTEKGKVSLKNISRNF